jgi:hypothetical protein
MTLAMARRAQPSDIQRLGIVVVVSVKTLLRSPAVSTRIGLYQPPGREGISDRSMRGYFLRIGISPALLDFSPDLPVPFFRSAHISAVARLTRI